MDKRKSICIAVLVTLAGFGWIYGEDVTTAERNVIAPDFRFVADDGSVMQIIRDETAADAKIIVKDPRGKETIHELGYVHYFGEPWITESPGCGSQIAVVPYNVGHGTGFAVSDYCLVCVHRGVVHFEDMGLCRYWSVSPASPRNFTFELNPCFWAYGREPSLKFTSVTKTEKGECLVEGYVTVKVAVKDEDVEATLVPSDYNDAQQCVKLLNHHVSTISEWAEEILANTVGREKMQDYRQSKRKRRADDEQSTEEILKAIRSYYEEK